MPDSFMGLNIVALAAAVGTPLVAHWALLIYWIAKAPTIKG